MILCDQESNYYQIIKNKKEKIQKIVFRLHRKITLIDFLTVQIILERTPVMPRYDL